MDKLSELHALEAEAVFIIREVVSQLNRPVMLFSAGKDSVVLLHLAEKAFRPGKLPFPIMHVDTGHNFPEVLQFRDERTRDHQLIIASVQQAIDDGRVHEDPSQSRNRLQIRTLLDALSEGQFDVAFGGARRDEDKARAKERFLSFRDRHGTWDPRNQRVEPWTLFNTLLYPGESIRCFPLSNWTELDIWRYIAAEKISLPSIYYAHEREVFDRDGILLSVSEYVQPTATEHVTTQTVRYRTVGDLTITGAVPSTARTPEEVIAEISGFSYSERGQTRADDKTSVAAMEDRKKEGYF